MRQGYSPGHARQRRPLQWEHADVSGGSLKVLIVSATNLRRGAEIQASALTSRLHEAGLEAEHVALSAPLSGGRALEIDVLGSTWRSIRSLWRLRRRAQQADVVIAFGSVTLPACAIALIGSRTPFVFRSIGDPAQWLRGSVHRWRTSLVVHRASCIAALWQGDARSITEEYRVQPSAVSIIPNARSADEFPLASDRSRLQARRKLGLGAQDRIVAVIGALSDEKRVDRAIETIAMDVSLQGVIAGDGPLRKYMDDLATRVAPQRIRFLGTVENIQDVYAAVDVVLITSRTEGMPGVAIEAGLSGVPVVSTNVGGITDVVRSGLSGRVVESDEASDLLDGIHSVLSSPVWSSEDIRSHCRAQFGWEAVGPMWIDLLTSVAKKHPR